MASGQIVAAVLRAIPPASSYATPDVRAGGSSPAERVPVWDFDDTSVEIMDFLCFLSPTYEGGGLTVVLPWSATTATSGAVVWGAAIRSFPDDTEDADVSQTYDFNLSAADTTATASGEVSYATLTFSDGVDMDSLVAGQVFILRVKRIPTDAGDNMSGDAELWLPIVKET